MKKIDPDLLRSLYSTEQSQAERDHPQGEDYQPFSIDVTTDRSQCSNAGMFLLADTADTLGVADTLDTSLAELTLSAINHTAGSVSDLPGRQLERQGQLPERPGSHRPGGCHRTVYADHLRDRPRIGVSTSSPSVSPPSTAGSSRLCPHCTPGFDRLGRVGPEHHRHQGGSVGDRRLPDRLPLGQGIRRGHLQEWLVGSTHYANSLVTGPAWVLSR